MSQRPTSLIVVALSVAQCLCGTNSARASGELLKPASWHYEGGRDPYIVLTVAPVDEVAGYVGVAAAQAAGPDLTGSWIELEVRLERARVGLDYLVSSALNFFGKADSPDYALVQSKTIRRHLKIRAAFRTYDFGDIRIMEEGKGEEAKEVDGSNSPYEAVRKLFEFQPISLGPVRESGMYRMVYQLRFDGGSLVGKAAAAFASSICERWPVAAVAASLDATLQAFCAENRFYLDAKNWKRMSPVNEGTTVSIAETGEVGPGETISKEEALRIQDAAKLDPEQRLDALARAAEAERKAEEQRGLEQQRAEEERARAEDQRQAAARRDAALRSLRAGVRSEGVELYAARIHEYGGRVYAVYKAGVPNSEWWSGVLRQSSSGDGWDDPDMTTTESGFDVVDIGATARKWGVPAATLRRWLAEVEG